MKSSTDTFFILLSESLVIFMIFALRGANDEVAKWILAVLTLSFIIAYSGSFIFSKIIKKIGDRYYALLMLIQQVVISTLMYIISRTLGYNTEYITFILIYIILSLITYNLNKMLFIKEINYLNKLIKK